MFCSFRRLLKDWPAFGQLVSPSRRTDSQLELEMVSSGSPLNPYFALAPVLPSITMDEFYSKLTTDFIFNSLARFQWASFTGCWPSWTRRTAQEGLPRSMASIRGSF